jgi:hypothetical protein
VLFLLIQEYKCQEIYYKKNYMHQSVTFIYIFYSINCKTVTGSALNVVGGMGVGGGGSEAAEDMSCSVWKQLTRISLKQHCAMLGKLRLRDCNLTGSQVTYI